MRTAQIKQLFRIIGGKPAPKGDDAFSDEGTPFIKMKDLGRVHFSSNLVEIEQRVSDAVAKRERLNLVRRGSILLPRSGSVALNHRAVLGTDAYMVSHICALEVTDQKEVNNLYAYYYLRSIKMDRISKKTTGLDAITFEDLGKLSIPLPPLNDQIRIAQLLGKVEGLIAQRKQHLQQLEDLLKSVFMKMFGDSVRNEKDWEYRELDGYITHLTSGGRGWAKYYSKSGKRFIRSLDVQMNHIGEDDIAYVTPPSNAEADRTRVNGGDVLLTITGSKIGRVCFVPENFEEAYISQHVSIIRTKGLNPIFLSYYLSAEHSGQIQIKKQQYGQAKPGLNLTQIRNFQIPLVDISTQNLFAGIFERVEKLKARYQQSLNDLESLYGALSQRAFKGELDLSQVPLPEPEQSIYDVDEAVLKPEEQVADKTLAINLPDHDILIDALTDKEKRNDLFSLWLKSYCQQIGNRNFSIEKFIAAAQTRIAELHPDDGFELNTGDYDAVKNWVFEALEKGILVQRFNEQHNQVYLCSNYENWGKW